MGSLQRQQNSF